MSLTSWYNNQYSVWSRTRRIQQTPYLARTQTNVSRTATQMAQQQGPGGNGANAVVIDMGDINGDNAPTAAAGNAGGNASAKDKENKKPQDSLFGPNIGIVSSGPAWTINNEKKVLADELTPEIVRGWIEKSKEASQPTTTLQALVNLKRPTLRLTPLSNSGEDSESTHSHLHGLSFEYDCDAPKCGIYVNVLLPAAHPDAPAASSAATGLSKLLVFENVTEGGFGKVLKLEEGAALDLARFEGIPPSSSKVEGDSAAKSDTSLPNASTEQPAPVPEAVASPSTEQANATASRNRRRFTSFHFRKRSNNQSVSGPALAVMDAEPASSSPDSQNKNKDTGEDGGVKVTIRLAALDEQGAELSSPNEQVTYLHVVRFGALSTVVEEPPKEAEAKEGDKDGADAKDSHLEKEDTRPWVVKVVKREATIGPHTFHLHEIYGLSSSSHSQQNAAPTAPLPSSHTYPPQPSSPTTAAASAQPVTEDEPSSECLLCLSSPREVVLLPCRHLVACKECALNMVEFGAGGTITQAEEPVANNAAAAGDANAGAEGANAEGGENNNNAGATGNNATTPTAAAPNATTTRRKRKAKGWFCPVCRQPYTSLLRITTTPPPPPTEPSKEGEGAESAAATANGEASNTAAASDQANNTERSGGGGILSNLSRPAFLRGFSRGGGNNQQDVEAARA